MSRKFTVSRIGEARPDLVIVADYMTRYGGSPDLFKFWVRRKWWQSDDMVGIYEVSHRHFTQCSSEPVGDDVGFLSGIGVRP